MAAFPLRLFGPPCWLRDGREAPLAPERLFQMLVHLAVRRDWVTREQLAALLWPDVDAPSARRNVRKLLFRMRQLAPAPDVEERGDALRWLPGCDLVAVEAALARGDAEGALDGCRGPLLEGFERHATEPFVEWLRFERERLSSRLRDAAGARLAALHVSSAHDARPRAALAARWLAFDPLDEDAALAAIDAAVAMNNLRDARRLYERFVETLAAQVGVEPSARMRAAEAALSQGETGASRPVAAAAAVAARPRADGPSLIGRRLELHELVQLLAQPDCRVLTITGPGGVGKSRLARSALQSLVAGGRSGAWVPLDDLSQAAQVAPRLADLLSVPLAGDADPLAQVVAHVAARTAETPPGGDLLIVLDNSEHLPGIAAVAAALAAVGPRLRILNTSRTRLAIDGEWLLPLAGLPVPDADEVEPDALAASDAVRLFEQRALAVAPSFALAGQAHEVAALVRAVDGVPLAIELAAAWVRMLPVAEIRREIDSSLDVLSRDGSGPAAGSLEGRQQSVRASFAHSWRLLADAERRALARLSVFAGPFTRAAANQVAEAPLPLLASLVDKSLLRAEGDGRFAFHALMLQCARERLAGETNDAEATVRRRHSAYFARLLQAVPAAASGNRRTLDDVEATLEDCRSAWQFATSAADTRAVEAMTPTLVRFFDTRGRWDEGLALFRQGQEALAAAGAAAPAIDRALGTLLYRKGELVAAEASMRRAAAAYEAAQDTRAWRPCLLQVALMRLMAGDVAEAERCFAQTLALADADGDEPARAQPLNGLALCARSRGDYARAVALHEQTIALHRAAGDVLGTAVAVHDLGTVLRIAGRHAESLERLHECLHLCDDHGLAAVRVFCLVNLGITSLELRRYDDAESYLVQALAVEQDGGHNVLSSLIRASRGRIRTQRGQFAEAGAMLRESLERALALASVPTQLATIVCFGELLALRGERIRGAACLLFAQGQPQSEAVDRDDARNVLAGLALQAGERAEAERVAAGLALDRLCAELLRAA